MRKYEVLIYGDVIDSVEIMTVLKTYIENEGHGEVTVDVEFLGEM